MINEQELYRKAIDEWGTSLQEAMMIEEMAELTQAITKYWRHPIPKYANKVLGEMADVQIMLDQLKLMYDPNHQFVEIKAAKLRRLQERLEGGG